MLFWFWNINSRNLNKRGGKNMWKGQSNFLTFIILIQLQYTNFSFSHPSGNELKKFFVTNWQNRKLDTNKRTIRKVSQSFVSKFNDFILIFFHRMRLARSTMHPHLYNFSTPVGCTMDILIYGQSRGRCTSVHFLEYWKHYLFPYCYGQFLQTCSFK